MLYNNTEKKDIVNFDIVFATLVGCDICRVECSTIDSE